MREVYLREYELSFDLDKIRQVAGNPNLQTEQVFDFGTFIIANSKPNRNHSIISEQAQKSAVKKWISKPIYYRDHKTEVSNQIGRIFDAVLETRSDGTYTIGRGYGIRTDDLKDVFLKIENGIHREMSCAYEPVKSVCSECNKELAGPNKSDFSCGHKALVLDLELEPDHISFVGRPGIEGAGVIHNADELNTLRMLAADGALVRVHAEQTFSKWFHLKNPQMLDSDIKSMMNKMTAKELYALAGVAEHSFRDSLGSSGEQQLVTNQEDELPQPSYRNIKDIFSNRRVK